ncbi:altered inheritance of mitochondria protein 41, mitochondrial [Nadsonia fulvescens var. elongata DSM 6958]|uniref:Altered inheritance of mitochondria protein 41 n=1 Tax=Nadsonia fulvescens var. elongata DSM 6958 TaxID=857566 RepID=A0A1E3PF50_9ASCO|nr:altered inheritance of mitochondria protein 41, mitochondrial [Nadsonia fulvescens var. elongata DSM 6958]
MATVREDLKKAMRAGLNTEKIVIRGIMSEIKNKNIDKAGTIATDFNFADMISTMAAARERSIAEFKEAKREDLVEKEMSELVVLKRYLEQIPMASEVEIDAKVKQVISSLGLPAGSKISVGKVMAKIPWKSVEDEWNASAKVIRSSVMKLCGAPSKK